MTSERNIFTGWIITFLVVVSISAIIYYSKSELHQSAEVISLNTRLSSITQEIYTTILKLEVATKRFRLTGSKSDSMTYKKNIENLKNEMKRLEAFIHDQPVLNKYFIPLQHTLNKELPKIVDLSFASEKSRRLDPKTLAMEEDVYDRIRIYSELLDNEGDRITDENVHVIQKNIDKNLNYFIVLVAVYILLLSLLFRIVYTDARRRRLINKELKQNHDNLVKIKEELAALNAQKDKLFSTIAHDLRSPFTALFGLSQLLIEDYDQYTDEQKKSDIKIIHDTLRNLLEMINNLLTWSRMQFQNRSDNPEKINLCELIDSVLTPLHLSAANKEIKFEVSCADDAEVVADRNITATVLRNLVSNAIKFTNKNGMIKVIVTQNGEGTIVEVNDNGVGMDSGIVQNIFNPDINNTRRGTENEKGTGLGLIICKEFVEQLGGKLWVKSRPGHGSSFYFTINQN